MLEMGTRFYKNLYIKTSFDPSEGTCIVTVETVNGEGTEVVMTGEVVWDEGE